MYSKKEYKKVGFLYSFFENIQVQKKERNSKN
jgi:hypothetical protein